MKKATKGILETLQGNPEEKYGTSTIYEGECIDAATKILLEAKESLEYRGKLLEALIGFNRTLQSYSDSFTSEGC